MIMLTGYKSGVHLPGSGAPKTQLRCNVYEKHFQ